jgi:hypothetical protein
MNKIGESHNHSDFARNCRAIWGTWEKGGANRALEARDKLNLGKAKGAPEANDAEVNELLEAHVRGALLDGFLYSLQWKMGSTLHIELGGPKDKDTRLYLDYLGVSNASARPLLVFEAKRQSVKLPVLRERDTNAADAIARILSDLGNSSGPWVEILEQLGSYWEFATRNGTVNSVKRVAISNGDWLVVFQKPAESFGANSGTAINSSTIRVFEGIEEIIARSEEVFWLLAYSQLTDDKEWLAPGSVKNYFADGKVERAMFGLTLDYSAGETLFGPNPHIAITPVLYLFAKGGGWIGVRDEQFDIMPSRRDGHAGHLATIEGFARRLLDDVTGELGYAFPVVPIDEAGLLQSENLPPVRRATEVKSERYELITGVETHFWSLPDMPGPCMFHSWAEANSHNVAHQNPIRRSSVDPRCFFAEQHPCHCAHRARFNTKKLALRVEGKTVFAFCKIWEIDQYLCCRSCVYNVLCFKNEGIKACDPRPAPATA